jgi:hypothetical protein
MSMRVDKAGLIPPGATDVGSQAAGLQISRRQLLGGLATTSALGYAPAAAADYAWYDIRFELSTDQTVLSIVEVGVSIGVGAVGPAARKDLSTWRVPVAAFGPNAWFDMAKPASVVTSESASERHILVRDATYGGRTKVVVGFRFTRPMNGERAGRWHIAYDTNLWLASHGGTAEVKSTPPVPFSAFLASKRLAETFVPTRVGATIDRVFASRLAVSSPAPQGFFVELDKNLVWHVQAKGRGGISAFDGQAIASELVFGWRKVEGREAFFAAQATLKVGDTVRERLVIGDTAGHHVLVSLPQQRPEPMTALLQVRVGVSPLDPGVMQTVAGLRLVEGEVSVRDGTRTISGSIHARNLTLSCTALPGVAGTTRTVLWGDAFGGVPPHEAAKPDSLLLGEHPDTRALGQREITSPIGWLRVGPPNLEPIIGRNGAPAPTKVVEALAKPDEDGSRSPNEYLADARQQDALESRAAADRYLQAANGDKGGAREATIFVVHDAPWPSKSKLPAALRRVSIDLALHEASTALPDASYSRLTFAKSDLRLVYDDGQPLPELQAGEYPRPQSSSFVWVGPVKGEKVIHAALDLSRATLTCARDYDLAKLRLRFHDFVLAFTPTPMLRPARDDCRVLEREGGTITDNRPILVAEFDPQHVMEEAVFRPQPPPLPDVELTDELTHEGFKGTPRREAILTHLKGLRTEGERTSFRTKIRELKLARAPVDPVFNAFASNYEKAAVEAELPRDQQVYIGPFALDADAMGLARREHARTGKEAVTAAVAGVLGRVAGPVQISLKDAKRLQPIVPAELPTRTNPALVEELLYRNAVRNESLFEQQEPLYGVFRDYWRERVVAARSLAHTATPGEVERVFGFVPNPVDLRTDEYLSENNRPPDLNYDGKAVSAIQTAFVDFVRGLDPIPNLVSARLSGGSRLAFRVNCEPVAGLTAEDAGLPRHAPNSPTHPGPGSVAYEPLSFTFDALTDWSRHEMSVTQRARKLFNALPSGRLPPLGSRPNNVSDPDILRFQGLSEGPTTAAQRMTEVRAALVKTPGELETAIEIPSRLILSPAQDAVWYTSRRLPKEVLQAKGSDPIEIDETPRTPSLATGIDPAPTDGKKYEGRGHDLWAARLAVPAGEPDPRAVTSPDLRVVSSPDLRPMALGGFMAGDRLRLPGHGAPPRGPYAPWFVGLDQMESETITPGKAQERILGDPDETKACNPTLPDKRPRLIRWLCDRGIFRKALPVKDYGIFRTSLDANDRHQLVLLSSAYGLPVIGRRQQVGDDVEISGGLVNESGQIEPTDAFALLDAKNDQAIYRPISLDVKELSLTALGGSFRHDTAFKPAAGADDVWGRKIFDGLSIERWQHETVLGRDVRARVVYRGYLFPFGHRASLTKLTERVFLRTPEQGVKAMLRQRLYLEVAKPTMAYPAVGQPHVGRMWCGQTITLLTAQTPDLIDPTLPIGTTVPSSPAEGLNGRINIAPHPGLVFWPRTDITPQGRFRFEIDIDGAKTALPLIFVDNIAATNGASLSAVAAYYTGVDEALRRMSLGGQRVRFANSSQTGDTSYAADTIVVRATGRLKPGRPSWTGDLTEFQTTGVLEGAEQPSFYPALDYARVRLEQVERFSGGKPLPVEVQFDGHYVRHGFVGDARSTPEAELSGNGNPLDVFLNLRAAVKLDMGSNGDRAAAIGRPNSSLIALSRAKGPLGGDGTVWWRTSATTPDVINEEIKADLGGIDAGQQTPKPQKLENVASRGADLVSLAAYFNSAAASRTSTPAADTSKGGPQSAVALQADGEDLAGEALAKLRIVQSYFSGDAKLLGTITLKELMRLLDIDPNRLPVLQEVVEYGTAAGDQVNQALGELATDVRVRVLTPLRGVVARMRREIHDLNEELRDRQQAVSGGAQETAAAPFTLEALYPEITAGLAGVDATLTEALATDDAVVLTSRLAAVYESTRRLIQGLSAVAANPVERMQDAVGADLRRRLTVLTSRIDELVSFAGKLQSILAFVKKPDAGRIADWIVDQIRIGAPGAGVPPAESATEAILAEQLSFTLGYIDLVAVARAIAGEAETQLQHELKRIGDDLSKELALSADDFLRALIKAVVAEILEPRGAAANSDEIVRGTIGAYLTSTSERTRDAIQNAAKRVRNIATAAKSELVEAAALAAEAELHAYRDYVVDYLAEQIKRTALERLPAELATLYQAARRILRAFDSARRLAQAIDTKRAEGIFVELLRFAQDEFGLDVASLEDEVGKKLGEASSKLDAIGRVAQAQVDRVLAPATFDSAVLAKEIKACALYRKDPATNAGSLPVLGSTGNPIGSGEPLDRLALAIKALGDALTTTRRVTAEVAANEATIRPVLGSEGYRSLLTFSRGAGDLLTGTGDKSRPGLLADAKLLYCAIVDLVAALQAIKTQVASTPWSKLDRDTLERWSVASRQLRRGGDEIGAVLTSMVRQMIDFLLQDSNGALVGSGVMFAAAAQVIEANPNLDATVRTTFTTLRTSAEASEKAIAGALGGVVNFAFRIIREGAMLTASLASDAGKSLADAEAALSRSSLSLQPQSGELLKALGEIERHVSVLAGFRPVGPTDKIRALLDTDIGNGETVRTAFEKTKDSTPFQAAATRLRDVEARLLAEWRALLQRLAGFPDALKARIETLVIRTGAFATLADGYDAMWKARNEVLSRLQGIPILRAAATRSLLVCEPDRDTCTAEAPSETDRLALEAKFLGDVKKLTSGPIPASARNKFMGLLQAWSNSTAAPLVVVEQSREIAANVLRGDILAVLDLGALRDQFEDAIAGLIPTRATLRYDFNSSINTPSGANAIFQPKVGARFGIEVKAVVDLLAPERAEFRARGYLGAFDIKLIGGVVDALTLKFGGAGFELIGGAKPRFDVSYDDFVIGRDLEFAQKLQSYLVPEEGSGVFVQPLTRGVGIEAGYSLDLGTLSVGTTSFFNVTLNVSAELPFDSGESLFKVSLGRRLAPFTMSALPFAGSGYFSVFAAADGVRGFEASFEFGAGGAIGFGVLTVQARLQVGVFVRVLRVNNQRITELYGTFFAGGSANIWIFHFATSLYVRLGKAEGGNMYGEAIYSFSFSLGLADYDYSVTAYRKEPALGSKQQSSGLLDDAPGGRRSRVQFAALAPTSTASDASTPGWGAGDLPDSVTVVRAADPLDDWATYSSYFDPSLLPESALL